MKFKIPTHILGVLCALPFAASAFAQVVTPAPSEPVVPRVTLSDKGLGTLALGVSNTNRILKLPGNSGQVAGNVDLSGNLARVDGTTYAIGNPTRTSVTDGHDAAYSWGTVLERVTVENNKLKWRVDLKNTSNDILNLTGIKFLEFATPLPIFTNNASSNMYEGLGAIVSEPDPEIGSVAFVLEQGAGSIQIGTRHNAAYELRYLPEVARIGPGESRVVQVSLRFGTGVSSLQALGDLAGDALTRTRLQKPLAIDWPNRNPVGRWFLASAGKHPASNPNGWFSNDPLIDTLTPTGRAAFATRLLARAQQVANRTTTMGAQGNIVWDIEGQRFGHPISYLGMPLIRDLFGKVVGVSLPPEMTQEVEYGGVTKPLVDHVFSILAAKGKVGICIRHTNALTSAFLSPVYPSHYDEADVAQTLIDKITYAKQRWGCTIFYVDTNPVDVRLLERVAQACPWALIIIENMPSLAADRMVSYRATEALGQIEPLSISRKIWPGSIGFMNPALGNFKNVGQRARILAERKRGSIQSYEAGSNPPANAEVVKIEQEAALP